MVTEPSAGKGGRVSERASQRDVLYRKRGGGGGGRMGRLTLAIILMIPLLSASQQTSPSRASSPTSSLNLKRAYCSDSVYECGLRRCSGGQVERNSDRTLPSVFSCCSGSDGLSDIRPLPHVSVVYCKDDSRQQLTFLFCSCVTGHTVSTNWK